MKKPDSESAQPSTGRGPARMMSNQMSVYYSNCAMVATTPRDISLFFGRFTPLQDDSGNQSLGELYERQIYMTIEQAEDLVKMLTRTLEAFRSRRQGSGEKPEQSK